MAIKPASSEKAAEGGLSRAPVNETAASTVAQDDLPATDQRALADYKARRFVDLDKALSEPPPPA